MLNNFFYKFMICCIIAQTYTIVAQTYMICRIITQIVYDLLYNHTNICYSIIAQTYSINCFNLYYIIYYENISRHLLIKLYFLNIG